MSFLPNPLGKSDGAASPLPPDIHDLRRDPLLPRVLPDRLQFLFAVASETVDRNDDGHSEESGVFHLLAEVLQAPLESLHVGALQIRQRLTPVHFQGPYRRDEDHRGRGETAVTADDVEELLRSEVTTESRLGDGHIEELHAQLGRQDRVRPLGDVGEGSPVNEGGSVLCGLDNVRFQGILENRSHGPLNLEVSDKDRFVPVGCAHVDVGESLLELFVVPGEAEDGHDLRGGGDGKAPLPGDSVFLPPQTEDHVSQGPVVHVHDPGPTDSPGVEKGLLPPEEVVVYHRPQKVVGRADGVDISGEVEVDLLHGKNLGPPPSGRSALDPEERPHGGLSKGDSAPLPYPVEGQGEADGNRRLPFPGGGRGDSRDQDQLPVRFLLQLFEKVEGDLPLVSPVGFDVLPGNPRIPRDLLDLFQRHSLRDLQIRRHRLSSRSSTTGHSDNLTPPPEESQTPER